MPIHYLSKYFNSENKTFIDSTPLGYQRGVFQRLGLFGAIKIDRIQGVQIVKSYLLIRRLTHHAVYNTSIIGVIVLSNEMVVDIILRRVWHTISSLKLIFKRGQGRLPYILLLLGNMSCHVIYQKSNQIS